MKMSENIFYTVFNGYAQEIYTEKGWTEKAYNEVLTAIALTFEEV